MVPRPEAAYESAMPPQAFDNSSTTSDISKMPPPSPSYSVGTKTRNRSDFPRVFTISQGNSPVSSSSAAIGAIFSFAICAARSLIIFWSSVRK